MCFFNGRKMICILFINCFAISHFTLKRGCSQIISAPKEGAGGLWQMLTSADKTWWGAYKCWYHWGEKLKHWKTYIFYLRHLNILNVFPNMIFSLKNMVLMEGGMEYNLTRLTRTKRRGGGAGQMHQCINQDPPLWRIAMEGGMPLAFSKPIHQHPLSGPNQRSW